MAGCDFPKEDVTSVNIQSYKNNQKQSCMIPYIHVTWIEHVTWILKNILCVSSFNIFNDAIF